MKDKKISFDEIHASCNLLSLSYQLEKKPYNMHFFHALNYFVKAIYSRYYSMYLVDLGYLSRRHRIAKIQRTSDGLQLYWPLMD